MAYIASCLLRSVETWCIHLIIVVVLLSLDPLFFGTKILCRPIVSALSVNCVIRLRSATKGWDESDESEANSTFQIILQEEKFDQT